MPTGIAEQVRHLGQVLEELIVDVDVDEILARDEPEHESPLPADPVEPDHDSEDRWRRVLIPAAAVVLVVVLVGALWRLAGTRPPAPADEPPSAPATEVTAEGTGPVVEAAPGLTLPPPDASDPPTSVRTNPADPRHLALAAAVDAVLVEVGWSREGTEYEAKDERPFLGIVTTPMGGGWVVFEVEGYATQYSTDPAWQMEIAGASSPGIEVAEGTLFTEATIAVRRATVVAPLAVVTVRAENVTYAELPDPDILAVAARALADRLPAILNTDDGAESQAPIDQLDALFASVLPDGFTPVHSTTAPSIVVAYNDDGVRLEVLIDIDAGSADSSGETALSPHGDRVTGNVIYTYDVFMTNSESSASELTPPQSLQDTRAEMPDVLTGLAEGFTGQTRDDILAATDPVIGSAGLRDAVDAIGEERFGFKQSERTLGAGDFAFAYQHNDVAYTIAVIRTTTGLPDGITQPSATTTTGRTWANGWQAIITTAAATPDRAVSEVEAQELLESIRPLLTDWHATEATVETCDAHTVQFGDSDAGLAEQYGVTLDMLRAANPDLDVNMRVGATVNIPCNN